MIDPNHVLKVGAATDLYVEQLQAKNAELEKGVERLKVDIEFVTNARIQDAKDAETNCKQFNRELRQQLAIAEEHNARLIAGLMKAAVHIRPTCDDLYYELKAIFTRPASREALDKYVAEIQASGNTAKHLLSELLAVLHRDGGHHEDKVGTAQAVEDAMQVFYKLSKQRDLAVSALKQSREALRLPCDRWNKTQFEIVQSAIASIDSAIKESEV